VARQQRIAADRHCQLARQSRSRPAAKRETDLLLDLAQPQGAPGFGLRDGQALGKDAAPAREIRAAEASNTDVQFDDAPLPRQVGQTPRIRAMRAGACAGA
jgi:hypothetical protein